jgi:hypothetical protein
LRKPPPDPLDTKLLSYDLLRITTQRGRIVPEAADHALVADLHADLPGSMRYQLAQTARLLREIEREIQNSAWIDPENLTLGVRAILERITRGDTGWTVPVTSEGA